MKKNLSGIWKNKNHFKKFNKKVFIQSTINLMAIGSDHFAPTIARFALAANLKVEVAQKVV
jgi:hypothetical protein